MSNEEIDSNIDYEIIGGRIKEKRKEKGITQEELAERMNISIAYLSRIERGQAKVNLKRLFEISEKLDVNISELITGTSTKTDIYLDKEIKSILETCTPEKQKLIYHVAKIIAGIDFKQQ